MRATGSPPTDRVAANLDLLDDLCEHFLAEYLRCAPVSRVRVVLWESCDLVTTMLHAWTKVRLLRIEPRLTVLLHQLRTSGLLDSASRREPTAVSDSRQRPAVASAMMDP